MRMTNFVVNKNLYYFIFGDAFILCGIVFIGFVIACLLVSVKLLREQKMDKFKFLFLKRKKVDYLNEAPRWGQVFNLLVIFFLIFSESLFSSPRELSSGLNVLGDLEGQQIPEAIKKTIQSGKPWIFMGDPIDRGPHALKFINSVAEQIIKSGQSGISIISPNNEDIQNKVDCGPGCDSKHLFRPYTVADNRGTNKLRLLFELTSDALRYPPRHSDWSEFFLFVKEKIIKDKSTNVTGDGSHEGLLQRSLSDLELEEKYKSDIVMRLKFILEKTMGAPKGFENRKLELKENLKRTVTDLEVVEAMISDLKLNGKIGSLGKILLNNQVITRSQDGYVFIHGGILEEALGKVPTGELDEMGNLIYEKVENFKDWASQLNHFYHEQVFKALNDNVNPEALMLYQEGQFVLKDGKKIRTPKHSESVIYGRYSDAQGNPTFPSEKVWSFLGEENHTIVNAHTPVGKYPILLLNSLGTKRLLLTDTSYSEERTDRKIQIQDKDIAIEFSVPQSDGGGIFFNFHTLGSKRNTSVDEKEGFRLIGFIRRNSGEVFQVKHRIGTLDRNPFQSIYKTVPVDMEKLRTSPHSFGANEVLAYALDKKVSLFQAKKAVYSQKSFSCLKSYLLVD